MESDKRYFLEGLFIIFFVVAAVFAFVWLAKTGHRDDILYRIHFGESVSGIALGDPVKFHGVDVGMVKTMKIDTDDPRLVRVDVSLRKDAPVKTDTKASLKMKGITGVVFIELDGGSANAKRLVEVTPVGKIPEIPYEKGQLTSLLDSLTKAIESFSTIGGQTKKVLSDVGVVTRNIKESSANIKETTKEVKEDPSLLLRHKKKEDTDK
jgi:phospholipid/cholesterol/gamma-HCH transport system substrate-binding protein